jgi:hypothetical protein
MTFDYAATAAEAAELLAEFGQSVTLTRNTPGAYNPETGAVSVSGATHTGMGCAFDYAQSDIDGTEIKRGDQRLYLSPKKSDGSAMPTPQTGDTVTIGAAVYAVMASRPLAPGGIVVLHDVQLRA